MMTTQTMPATANRDAQLVEWSLTGDRDAFRQIVERYQSLVCSITYNATGSLTLSEDLAQEAFVAAWKQLSELREPAQLRAWLCGITRFLVGKELRRQGREPIHAAEPLDAIHEPPSPEPSPAAQAVSREEEAILWRALERIPDAYRQPLILFYREQQSVERVAVELELSEDAVKQRLSRGRKLLHEEVIAFVEGTLKRTTPGNVFTIGVLAALPVLTTSAKASTIGAAAGAGTAAKGSAAAKSGGLLPFLGPWLGVFGVVAAQSVAIQGAQTRRERWFKVLSFGGMWLFIVAWIFVARPGLRVLREHFGWSDATFFDVRVGFWWCYTAIILALTVLIVRRILAIRKEDEETGAASQKAMMPMSRRLLWVIGVYVSAFSSWICVAWQTHDRFAAGIIAVVAVVLAAWNFLRLRHKTSTEAQRVNAFHVFLVWGAVLAILNWRLDVWLAAGRRIDLAEMHRLLPAWVIPLLTLALVIWSGVVASLTKPKRLSQQAVKKDVMVASGY
jgi:RNA polymerase sigma factor (sigma-70 family)